MARNPDNLFTLPEVIRFEPLESRVLYSADAAPLLALVDAQDRLAPNDQPPERVLSTLVNKDSDTQALPGVRSTDSVTQLVIVDTSQRDIASLHALLEAQVGDGEHIAIVTLPISSDPIEDIAKILSHYTDLDAVHIVSHASVGALQLGDVYIDQEALLGNSDWVQAWGRSLHVDGDILLYGCNLSASEDGRLFAKTLATLTEADVASSNDITGHALKNGDWDLEIQEGQVETPIVAKPSIQTAWNGNLDTTTGLIHHWKLDGNGTDSAGAADMAYYNSLGSVTGVAGQAADFSGDSFGSFKYGEAPSFLFPGFGTSDFTVAFWMQTSSSDPGDYLIGNKQGANGGGFSVYLNASGTVEFTIADGATVQSITAPVDVTNGDWHYIVAKRDGAALDLSVYNRTTDVWAFYNITIASTISVGSFTPVRMGVETPSSNNYDGYLDDIRFYNRAISFADANELANPSAEQVLAINNGITISETGYPVTITSSELLTTDADTPDTDLVYVIELLTGASELRLDGLPMSQGMGFTQDDINNGRLAIAATGMVNATADSIALTVDDGQGSDTIFALDVVIEPNAEQLVSSNSVTVDFLGPDLAITSADLQAVDPDNYPNELIFEIYQATTDVDLWLDGVPLQVGDSFSQADINNGLLSVVSTGLASPPSGEYVYFTVDDGYGSATNSYLYVNINTAVTVNSAPSAFHATFNINEDDVNPAGRTVDLLMGSGFADPDPGDYLSGILITSAPSVPTGGVWQYTTDGVNWYAVGTVSESSALALNNLSSIRFLPDANYNGTPGNLAVRVLDSTYAGPNDPVNYTDGANRELASAVVNGGTTAISGSIDFITVNVLPVNDSPALSDVTMPSFNEDGAPVLTTVQDIFGPAFSDPDTGDSLSAIAVVANPPTFEGEWAYSDNGTTWFYINNTSSTNALIISASDYFRFLPVANYNGSPPELVVHALDSTYTGGTTIGGFRTTIDINSYADGDELSALSAQASVTVIPVNDPPVIDTAASFLPSWISEDTAKGTVIGALAIGDVDNDPVTVNVLGEGASYFTVNAAYEVILIAPLNHEVDNYISLSFEAVDPSLATDVWATGFNVQDANDSPDISSASLAGVPEDSLNPPGATVSSLFASTLIDEDTGASLAGIAVTGSTSNSAGQWQYSSDGINWTFMGPASVPFAVAVSANDYVRFLPTADFSGYPGPLTVRALDNGYTGAFSTAGSPVQINTSNVGAYGSISVSQVALNTNVNPVNDRPVISDEVLASVVEDRANPPGESVLALFEIGMADADVGDSISGMIIVNDASDPSQGQWQYANPGDTWLPIGAVSTTQGLVLDSFAGIRFLPAADFNGTPGYLRVYGLDNSWTGGYTIFTPLYFDTTSEPSDSALSVNQGLLQTSITPVNDPPFIDAAASVIPVSVSEDTPVGTVVGTLDVSDVDNNLAGLSVTGEGASFYSMNALNQIVLTAPLNYEADNLISLTFIATDTAGATFSWGTNIGVQDANDAPLVTSATLPSVSEDTINPAGATIASLFGGTFADVDAGASFAGIAVSVSPVSVDGQWQYSNDGITWYTIVAPGSYGGGLVLAESDFLRFLPALNFNGTTPSLEVYALDDGFNGLFTVGGNLSYASTTGTGQFGSMSQTPALLHTAVSGVNDRPIVADAMLLPIAEDSLNPPGASLLALYGSTFVDIDTTANFTGMMIVGNSATASEGIWEYSVDGTNWLAVGSVTATQGLVLDRYSLVRFTPAANYSGNPGDLSLYGVDDNWSGGYSFGTVRITADVMIAASDSAFSSNTAVLKTAVNTVNDTPTAITPVAPLQVNENSFPGAAVGTVLGVDSDSTVLSYSLTNDAGGLFSIDANTGVITLAPGVSIDFEANQFHSITVQVTDPGLLSFSQALTVTVIDINEAPVLTSAVTIPSVNEDHVNNNGVQVGSVFQTVFSDPDLGQVLSGIAIVQHDSNSSEGQWEYRGSGGQWYSIGSVSQSNALVLGANDWIRFVPAANYVGPASTLTVHALDSSYSGGATVFPMYTPNLLNGSETAISVNPVAVTTTVLPVNDLPFNVQVGSQLRVDEDAEVGDSLGFVVAQDLDDVTLNYSLSADAGGRFIINTVTGEVIVAPTASLDYETDTFHQITVEILDSGAQPVSESFQVLVNDVNEAPLLAAPSPIIVFEDNNNPVGENIGAVFSPGFSDVDANDLLSAIVIVDNPSGATGNWQYIVVGGSWQNIGAVSTGNALILSATDEIRFVPAPNVAGAGPSLTVFALDSKFSGPVSTTTGPAYSTNLVADAGNSLSSGSVQLDVQVMSVNDTPTITLNNIVALLPENSAPALATDVADIVISDVDGGTNAITLSGTHAAYFQITGSKLQLKPGVVLDYEVTPQLDVVVEVNDATVGTTPDDVALYTLQIINLNEPPALTSIEPGNVHFVENGSPVVISNAIVVTEPDSGEIQTATIQVSSGYVPGQDVLSFINQNGISGTYDIATGTLILSGQATAAQYQAAIRSIEYDNISDNPNTAPRLIAVSVADNALTSNVLSRIVSITAIDDAPTIQLNAIVTSLLENTPVTQPIDIADIVVSDVDGGSNTLSLAGMHANLFQIVGNKLQLQAGLSPDAETLAQLDVTVNVDDASIGAGIEGSADYALLIDDVDEPPGISSIEPFVLNFQENSAALSMTTTIVVAEPDDGQIESAEIRFVSGYSPVEDTLSMPDQNGITAQYDQSSGVLSLSGSASAVDYQSAIRSIVYSNVSDNPSGTPRVLEVTVSDGVNSSNTLTRAVQIQETEDSPTIQLATLVSSLPENTSTGSAIDVAVIIVTDLDSGPNMLSLSGPDANLFQIVSDRLQLKPGVSLDSETASQLDVTVSVDDAGIGVDVEDSATYSLLVSGLDEPPLLSGMDVPELVYIENSLPMPVTSSLEVSETDYGMLSSAEIFIQSGFVPGEDWLEFTSQNGISGSYNENTGMLSLSGVATATEYQDAIRSVTYFNASDNPSTAQRVLHFSVNDGTQPSNVVERAMAVVAVNDEQQLTQNVGGTVQQNNLLVLTPSMLSATDAEQQPSEIQYSPMGVWPSVQLIVAGSPASGFTQEDVDSGLVALSFVGATPGINMIALVVDDGIGNVSVFEIPISVTAEPEPEPNIGAALPEPIVFVPEAVLSVTPAVDLGTFVSFESDNQTSTIIPEDGENIDVMEVSAALETSESVEASDVVSTGSLAELRIPDLTAGLIRPELGALTSVLSEPTQIIHKTIKFSDYERAELQMASLLSLESLAIEEQSVFRTVDRNIGMMSSIEAMQKQLERASENLQGNTSARDVVVGLSLSLTAGFLIWMLRGGALLASMFSISPLWKQLDPLPILSSTAEDDMDASDEDKVENLFGKDGNSSK